MSVELAVLERIPRVEELLEKLTLVEKAGQMCQLAWNIGDESQHLDAVQEGKVGSFLNTPSLEVRNRMQKAAVEQSRLGIPLIFGRDVIHGFKTVFPIPLGLAASFNPELCEQTAAAAAREASEIGVDWTFAPMVDVARDPRWGRVAEGSGEDPYLAARMGAAAVRGFQGTPGEQGRLAACAKHYAGYGASESGKDYNTTWIPEGLMRDVYLPPFRACVEAGVLTLMSAFNDLNGIPASASEFLLRQVLKKEWRFPGFVVSDWGCLSEMVTHGFCEDELEAAAQTARAGVDMEMVSRAYAELPKLVEAGKVPIELLDDAVRRILTVKFRLGLFDEPYKRAPEKTTILCQEHRALAQRAARETLVLLKNDNGLLPLSKDVESVAVIGPLADDGFEQLGCWAWDGDRDAAVTVVAALRQRLGEKRVSYEAGLPNARSTDEAGIASAVKVAEKAQVTLIVLGETANLSGEAKSRAFLDLPGAQQQLLEALARTGKPLVVVFMAGRPLTIGRACERAGAAIYAWHPGTMAGPALCDVLFGDAAPSGKLPLSFPRTVGQIPIYHAYKNTGRPPKTESKGIPTGTPLDPVDFDSSYLDVEVTPEFPFGFGLSYTSFEYSNLSLSKPTAKLGESVTVSVDLTNTGSVTGEEVAQLYVRDLVGSVTRPVRELKGFQRVRLAPGEKKRVSFNLTSRELEFCGRDLKTAAEPGKFQVFVGGDVRASLTATFKLE
jgi:beta-glucosidase